jgi:tRNA(Ile)-lysidine synthase
MTVRIHAPKDAASTNEDSELLIAIERNWINHELGSLTQADGSIPVVIGVSGGADSVCLLHALSQLSGKLALNIHVAHLNHNLRPESAEDAQFVASLCRQLDLPYHEGTLDADALTHAPSGLEDAARRARYVFLCRTAHQVVHNEAGQDQVPLVAVAHNMEDQAETLLLNLIRGSGLRGLRGMRWRTRLTWPAQTPADRCDDSNPAWLVRPLLTIRRNEIEAFLIGRHLDWREDSSNKELHFSRNLLRHQVLPQLTTINPNVVGALARTAQIVADDVQRLEQIDYELMADMRLTEPATGSDLERVRLDFTKFAALELPQQRGVVRAAIEQFSGGLYGVDAASIDRILGDLQRESDSDGPLATSGPHPLIGTLAWTFVSAGSRVSLAQDHVSAQLILHLNRALPMPAWGPQLDKTWRPVELPESGDLKIDGWRLRVERISPTDLPADWGEVPSWQALLDADNTGHPLLCRPANGMRIAPLGMGGQTRTLGNLFTDEKIHPTLRERWPLLVNGDRDWTDRDHVLWVCGLRLAHSARITDNTVNVLALTWEQTELG